MIRPGPNALVDVIENFPHSTHIFGAGKNSVPLILGSTHFNWTVISADLVKRPRDICEESSPFILAYFFRLSAEMGEKRPPTRIGTSVSGEYLSRVSGLGGDITTSGQMQFQIFSVQQRRKSRSLCIGPIGPVGPIGRNSLRHDG